MSLLEEYQHYSEVQYESVSNFDKGLRNKEQVENGGLKHGVLKTVLGPVTS